MGEKLTGDVENSCDSELAVQNKRCSSVPLFNRAATRTHSCTSAVRNLQANRHGSGARAWTGVENLVLASSADEAFFTR